MPAIWGLALSILANLLTLPIVLGLGLAYAAVRRRPLLAFFGLTDTRRLIIYTSHVRAPNGTLAVDGKTRSFIGSSAPFSELQMLEEYFRLFYFAAPEDSGLPGYFRSLLFSDIKLVPKLSPLSADEIDQSSSLIAFGSPAYNTVSKWIESQLRSLGTFGIDDVPPTINVAGLPPLTEPNTAFLQRTRITGSTFAFHAAGISSLGTRAAVYYLVSRWEYLYRRFGARENFIVILKAIDEDDHSRHIVLLERGEHS